MLERIGTPGYETLSRPDQNVLNYLDKVLVECESPVVYEIGVGIGATTLPIAERLNGNGRIYLFSREKDVKELSSDLAERGHFNVDASWGSGNKIYSGYHFELARGFVDQLLPRFNLAYIDGGHVFHLDAPATCVLKELCLPGGYMIFDDWYWTLERSSYYNPKNRPATAKEYDDLQIVRSHVQLVCKVVMDTDKRFRFVELSSGSAVYQRMHE